MIIEELGIKINIEKDYVETKIIDKSKFIDNYEIIYNLLCFACTKNVYDFLIIYVKDGDGNDSFFGYHKYNDIIIKLKPYFRKYKINKLLKENIC